MLARYAGAGKMLLERRKTSTGRSSQELLHMLNILEGDEENDDGAPDEMVLCRLCEQQERARICGEAARHTHAPAALLVL
jgi:hypothetical protein